MALIVREPRPEIGAFSLGGALKSVGNAIGTAAKTTAQGAVKGAGQSIADSLRSWLSPSTPTGGARPAGASLSSLGVLPYVAGGAGLLVVAFLAFGRHPATQTNPRRRRHRR